MLTGTLRTGAGGYGLFARLTTVRTVLAGVTSAWLVSTIFLITDRWFCIWIGHGGISCSSVATEILSHQRQPKQRPGTFRSRAFYVRLRNVSAVLGDNVSVAPSTVFPLLNLKYL